MLRYDQIRNAFPGLRDAVAKHREPTNEDIAEGLAHGLAIIASVIDSLTTIAQYYKASTPTINKKETYCDRS